ncbi:uncharacterized protein MONBRDRAFT_8764 [Monosiga brevicollis MX1]|uniref:Uncharacterized protein n=1 Tax=Monosiga brevicollis TaxID=81824 RepID=A9V126_MONBE|nr:uncharacterized protein MONBRDRAFT_8764 [Monosiga brevicollis MX1]EDQ88858.1 predicted protein [Monosiga brevicollis MX1]|eukprot:XP_001746471.1 hypothetical protein [Monosiga brevicollis MX1]
MAGCDSRGGETGLWRPLSLERLDGDDVPGSGAPWLIETHDHFLTAPSSPDPEDHQVGRYSDRDRLIFLDLLDVVDEHDNVLSDRKIADLLQQRLGKRFPVSTVASWRRKYSERLLMRAAGTLSMSEPLLKPVRGCRTGRPSVLDAEDESILIEYDERYGKSGSVANAREYLFAKRYKPLELSGSIEPWHVSLSTISNHLKKYCPTPVSKCGTMSMRPRQQDTFGPQTSEACRNYIAFLDSLDEKHQLFSSNKHALISVSESWMSSLASRCRGPTSQTQRKSGHLATRSSISIFAAMTCTGEMITRRTHHGPCTAENSQRYIEATIAAWREKYGSELMVILLDTAPHRLKAITTMMGADGAECSGKESTFVRTSSTILESDERYSPLTYYELDASQYGGPVLVVPTPRRQPSFVAMDAVLGAVKYAAEGIHVHTLDSDVRCLSDISKAILGVAFHCYVTRGVLASVADDALEYMTAWREGTVSEDQAQARHEQLCRRDMNTFNQMVAAIGGVLEHDGKLFDLVPIPVVSTDLVCCKNAAGQETSALTKEYMPSSENMRLLAQRDKARAQARARQKRPAAARNANAAKT